MHPLVFLIPEDRQGDMHHLPLNALRVLESVVRQGSFRAAAEELCVSQSAVSHQIKLLEQWFGKPLFDRSSHRPRPLPHTRVLADTLMQSLARIDQACQHTRRSSDSLTLVIAAIPSVAVRWLIPRLSSFRENHPDIAIRIIYAFHGQQLDLGDIDLAFVYSENEPVQQGVRAYRFLPGLSAPVSSPAVGNLIGDISLSSDRLPVCLLHDSDKDGWTRWFRKANGTALPMQAGPTFEDFNLLHAAVLAGQGIALCPLAMLDDDLSEGRLVQLSDITVNETFDYYLIENTLSDSSVSDASAAFRHWLFNTRDA